MINKNHVEYSVLLIIALLFVLFPSVQALDVSEVHSDEQAWQYEGKAGRGTDGNMAIASHKGQVFVSKDSGLIFSSKGNNIWTSAGNLDTSVRVLYSDGANLYAGATNGEVFQYSSGTSWRSLGHPAGLSVQVFSLVAFNNNLYAGCYDGSVYKFNGHSWISVGNPGSSAELWVKTLEVHNNKLYAGKIAGPELNSKGKVYRYSSNTAWSSVGYPDKTSYSDVEDLMSYNGKLIAVSNFGVVSYLSASNSWVNVANLPYTNVWSLAQSQGTLYAASNHLYYLSGENFIDASTPISDGVMKIVEYDNRIFATGNYYYEARVFSYDN